MQIILLSPATLYQRSFEVRGENLLYIDMYIFEMFILFKRLLWYIFIIRYIGHM